MEDVKFSHTLGGSGEGGVSGTSEESEYETRVCELEVDAQSSGLGEDVVNLRFDVGVETSESETEQVLIVL